MKAEHVNPFIISVCKVMKDMCMLDLKIGKPSLRQQSFPEENSLDPSRAGRSAFGRSIA